MGLKREHRESLTNLAGKQEYSLFTLRGEYAAKLTEYESKIADLEAQILNYQQEIERNKMIASIQVIPCAKIRTPSAIVIYYPNYYNILHFKNFSH